MGTIQTAARTAEPKLEMRTVPVATAFKESCLAYRRLSVGCSVAGIGFRQWKTGVAPVPPTFQSARSRDQVPTAENQRYACTADFLVGSVSGIGFRRRVPRVLCPLPSPGAEPITPAHMSPGEPSPISASTRLCAVYGHPVRHSASPAMQNAGIAALGLDWRYVACAVRPETLKEALAGAAAMRFLGVNLTVPHKLLAMGMMDVLDESARRWGAVNTVRFEGRDAAGDWRPLGAIDDDAVTAVRMHGFNTDADAIVRALREDAGVSVKDARVLLLGAGGAGRVAALRLAVESPAELWLVNRTESKAAAVAEEIVTANPELRDRVRVGYPEGPVDLVLNATSAGLKAGDPLPFDAARFDPSRAGAAYDMIYRPAETPFLADARKKGCRTASGLGMLLYQGAAALEIWSGRTAPVEAMRKALWDHVHGERERA